MFVVIYRQFWRECCRIIFGVEMYFQTSAKKSLDFFIGIILKMRTFLCFAQSLCAFACVNYLKTKQTHVLKKYIGTSFSSENSTKQSLQKEEGHSCRKYWKLYSLLCQGIFFCWKSKVNTNVNEISNPVQPWPAGLQKKAGICFKRVSNFLSL